MVLHSPTFTHICTNVCMCVWQCMYMNRLQNSCVYEVMSTGHKPEPNIIVEKLRKWVGVGENLRGNSRWFRDGLQR